MHYGQLLARTLSRINIADTRLENENLETATQANSERINAVTQIPSAAIVGLEELRDKVIKLSTIKTIEERTMRQIAANMLEENLEHIKRYIEAYCPHCAHCQCRI